MAPRCLRVQHAAASPASGWPHPVVRNRGAAAWPLLSYSILGNFWTHKPLIAAPGRIHTSHAGTALTRRRAGKRIRQVTAATVVSMGEGRGQGHGLKC